MYLVVPLVDKVHICLPYIRPKAGKAERSPGAAATGMGIKPYKARARRATMNKRPRFQAKGQVDSAEPAFPQQEPGTSFAKGRWCYKKAFDTRRT